MLGRSRGGIWRTGAVLVAIPVSVPIAAILLSLLAIDVEIWQHLQATVLGDYVINTLLLMLLVGVFSAVLGIATAWIVSAYEFPGRGLLSLVLVLPLAAPAYVVGYVYADLLDVSGPVQTALREAFGWSYGDYIFPNIRSLPGAALVIAGVLYPYVYLLAKASFSRQAGVLYEAAQTLGASPWRVFSAVALPAARPAVAGGLALVLMETVADYGVVEHYGVPTFTTGIFRTWYAMGERNAALQLAACLFLIVAVLVLLEYWGRRGDHFNPVSRPRPLARKRLSAPAAVIAITACSVPVLFGFALPFAVLVSLSVASGDPLWGSQFLRYMGNSVQVATIASLLCLLGALWLGYAQRLASGGLLSFGLRLATLGYALPGMVLAVGLLMPLTWLDRTLATYFSEAWDWPVGLILTGSTFALLCVYVARFLTVAFNSVQSGMLQIHPRFDDVGRTLGVRPGGVLRRVHLPLLRPALLTALLLVFIDVMKELPATLILRPFNFETLATRVFRLASDERLAEASTAALVIVVLGLIPTLMLLWTDRRASR